VRSPRHSTDRYRGSLRPRHRSLGHVLEPHRPVLQPGGIVSEFTPGPWVAHGSYINPSGGPPSVAVTLFDTEDGANARLIAAAPELYEALERIERDDHEDGRIAESHTRYGDCYGCWARTALGKARGES
jgi:hypothetical protein